MIKSVSNKLVDLEDSGATILLTFLSAITMLYWRLDPSKYPNFKKFLTFVPDKWLIAILVGSIIGIFLLNLNKRLREKSRKILQSANDQYVEQLGQLSQNIYNMFDGVILSLSQRFGFGKATKARISIYVNDQENERFVPCGRYSPDPVLRRKGRSSFSHSQGCIWQCWQDDFHYNNAIPATVGAFHAYQQREYNIPRETSVGLTMRPVLMAGKRVDDPLGQPIAVIILEVNAPHHENDMFSERNVREILENVCDDWGRLILTFEDYIPIPGDAEEAGL